LAHDADDGKRQYTGDIWRRDTYLSARIWLRRVLPINRSTEWGAAREVRPAALPIPASVPI